MVHATTSRVARLERALRIGIGEKFRQTSLMRDAEHPPRLTSKVTLVYSAHIGKPMLCTREVSPCYVETQMTIRTERSNATRPVNVKEGSCDAVGGQSSLRLYHNTRTRQKQHGAAG